MPPTAPPTASLSAETAGSVRRALDVTGAISYLRACHRAAVPVDPMPVSDRNPLARSAFARSGTAR
jgi:hypothetical protein